MRQPIGNSFLTHRRHHDPTRLSRNWRWHRSKMADLRCYPRSSVVPCSVGGCLMEILFCFGLFFLCLLGGAVHLLSPRSANMLPAGS